MPLGRPQGRPGFLKSMLLKCTQEKCEYRFNKYAMKILTENILIFYNRYEKHFVIC